MIETLFCTIDQKPIPEARAVRNSNTCSKGCAKKLRAIRRARANERACQVCGKPSTPQQRASYRRWLASNPATAPRKRGRPALARVICECGHQRSEHLTASGTAIIHCVAMSGVDPCRCRGFAAGPRA